jgi:hypothetical protein
MQPGAAGYRNRVKLTRRMRRLLIVFVTTSTAEQDLPTSGTRTAMADSCSLRYSLPFVLTHTPVA